MNRSAASLLSKDLRRYRDGVLPDWRMRKVLERELDRLVSEHSALLPEIEELRRAAPDRLTGFDTASERALQWLGECRFDQALAEIQNAADDLVEMQRSVIVAADWQRTGAALARLEELLSPELESQATVRVLRRLQDLGRFLLDQRETRKARFVLLLLANQTGLLMARRPGEPKAGFGRMLADLEAQDGVLVDRIRRLGHEGYHALAERLAEDLSAELAVNDRACRAAAEGGSLRAIERDLAAVRQQAQAVGTALTQWLQMSS